MKNFIKIALIISAITCMSGYVFAGSGSILTDKSGMTLYTFDKDKAGESVCYGACAEKWPPFIAGEYAKAKKGWGIISRKDGSKQWTYNDQPLYTWVGDTKAGDTTGDGVKGVWHVAKKIKAKSASYSQSSYSSYSSDY